MKNEIEITVTHKKIGNYAAALNTKLGREEAHKLRSSIGSAALLDADNVRKEAHVAVVKLSAALETTTRLLADAQKRYEEAEQMIVELSAKRPKA